MRYGHNRPSKLSNSDSKIAKRKSAWRMQLASIRSNASSNVGHVQSPRKVLSRCLKTIEFRRELLHEELF
jgi:hypothetical protein